jgi:quercetin dioxygenase-like cupin family protein
MTLRIAYTRNRKADGYRFPVRTLSERSTDKEEIMSRHVMFFFLTLALLSACMHFSEAGEQSSEDVPLAEPLKYARLYADSSGASHFSNEEMTFTLIDFAPPAPAISLSEAFNAKSVVVISSPAGWYGDWHPAPQRQFIFVLFGQLEVKVSDGEVRTFGPGSVVLVEDTFGKGHISRIIGKERGYSVVVPLRSEQE